MKMELTNTERNSLIPSAISALALFTCLIILIPGAGNILVSSVITLIAYPIIVLFTYWGISISNKNPIKSKLIHGALTIILGVFLGFIGYLIANSILYLQGVIFAFLISGAVAGLVVSLCSTANKSSNLTSANDAPSS